MTGLAMDSISSNKLNCYWKFCCDTVAKWVTGKHMGRLRIWAPKPHSSSISGSLFATQEREEQPQQGHCEN